jgi:hypothetical protein
MAMTQQPTQQPPLPPRMAPDTCAGLIDSLAKPGGNTTGVSILATELDGKKLDILKRIVGSGRCFAVLSDPSSAQAQPRLLIETARALGIGRRFAAPLSSLPLLLPSAPKARKRSSCGPRLCCSACAVTSVA